MNHAKEIGKKEAMDEPTSDSCWSVTNIRMEMMSALSVRCTMSSYPWGKEADMLLPDPVPKVYTLRKASALFIHRSRKEKRLRCDRFHGSFQSGTRR